MFRVSRKENRILVFNCTSGRSGPSFLGSVHSMVSAQLKLHKWPETPELFFDHVIFCTNVTYADGHFKGGVSFLC
jgi:folylpolyglutamate synthase